METDSQSTGAAPPPAGASVGGGAPLALLIIAGVIVGGLLGQPIIGFFVGLALGISVVIALWWRDRSIARGGGAVEPRSPRL